MIVFVSSAFWQQAGMLCPIHGRNCNIDLPFPRAISERQQGGRLTLHQVVLDQMTADRQAWVPLAILAGAVFILSPQGVALIAVVLDSCALGKAMAGGGVTRVAPVLWFTGWSASYRRGEKKNKQKPNLPGLPIHYG